MTKLLQFTLTRLKMLNYFPHCAYIFLSPSVPVHNSYQLRNCYYLRIHYNRVLSVSAIFDPIRNCYLLLLPMTPKDKKEVIKILYLYTHYSCLIRTQGLMNFNQM